MAQTTPKAIRETARGIILQNGNFLFIRRTRQNSEGGIDNWLSIPGGGLNPGETPEQTVIREMKEELDIDIDTKSLLAIQEESGEFERMQGKIPNTYAVEWTNENSPELPNGLFWAYAEAYKQFLPFVRSGRSEPLVFYTEG